MSPGRQRGIVWKDDKLLLKAFALFISFIYMMTIQYSQI